MVSDMKHQFKLILIAGLCIFLSGCLTLGGLKHKQISMLKEEGFKPTEEGWAFGLHDPLLFGFDKIESSPESIEHLTKLSERLLKYKLDHLKIVGYTDDIGNEDYNLNLSKQRAAYISSIFVEHGFKDTNVESVGRGSHQPLVPNTSDENRATNRRVSIIVLP